MYIGGVRVAIVEDGKILLVKQRHEDREIWMLPGGAIEEGETLVEAAEREILEETKLKVKVKNMLWFVEELREKKVAGENKTQQRFVAFFKAEKISGTAELGEDPEFDKEGQVLTELRYISKEELLDKGIVKNLYPEWLREEMSCLFADNNPYNPYKERR